MIFFLSIILLIIVTGAFLAYRTFQKRADSGKSTTSYKDFSFTNIVRDGKIRRDFFAMMNPGDMSGISNRELKALLKEYFSTPYSSGVDTKLWRASNQTPERLTPLLLEVIMKPGSEIRPPYNNAVFASPKSPLEKALEMLERGKHKEIISRLITLSDSEHAAARDAAGFRLAQFGSQEVAPTVAKLLSDADKHVVHGTLIGITHSLRDKKATPEFKKILFPALDKAFRKGTTFFVADPADLLLELDPVQGKQTLLDVIERNDHTAAAALHILNEKKIPVDTAFLWALLEKNKPYGAQSWNDDIYGEALKGLGVLKEEQIRPIIHTILREEASNERDPLLERQKYAAQALCLLEGFKLPTAKMGERLQRLGRKGVTQVERDLDITVYYEVPNGGFTQYFFNVDHDPMEDVAALERMNARKCAAVLHKACKTFGRENPSAHREIRMKQLEHLSEAKHSSIDSCDSEWYALNESFDALYLLYALKNRHVLENLE